MPDIWTHIMLRATLAARLLLLSRSQPDGPPASTRDGRQAAQEDFFLPVGALQVMWRLVLALLDPPVLLFRLWTERCRLFDDDLELALPDRSPSLTILTCQESTCLRLDGLGLCLCSVSVRSLSPQAVRSRRASLNS